MPRRKWLVRILVFTILGGCASVALLYQRWTNPAAVREQVLAKLQAIYPGAVVTVDAARLRILGGVVLSELRLSRRDDPDKAEVLHVPSAILYHDKEKMLDGQMVLRKVELYRPRLRVVRDRNGTWNLQGILGPSQPHLPQPTVVINQGTIVVDDRKDSAGATPVEIHDVNISFINDPLATVVIAGSASSEVAGQFQVKGAYQRPSRDLALSVKAKGVPLRTALLQRLHIPCPNNSLADLNLEARADVDARIGWHPLKKQPLEYTVAVNVSQGKLQHPKIPLPLTDLRATLECGGGTIRVRDFHARSGTAVLQGKAAAVLPSVDQFFDAEFEIKHLKVDAELMGRLPEKVRLLQQNFQATGLTTLRLACARRDGKWTNLPSGAVSHITLLPEDFNFCFVRFPYPLTKVKGVVDWNLQSQRTQVDLVGYSPRQQVSPLPGDQAGDGRGERPVLIRGSWQGEGTQIEAKFDIQASDVALEDKDDKLIAALPAKFQKLTNSFHPTGKIDLKAHIRRTLGSAEYQNQYHISLREGTICWDEFPYPLENVSAFLDIYPRHWEFRDGQGSFHGGQVMIQGKSLRRGSESSGMDDGLSLEITSRNLALDDHLRKALAPMPQLVRCWETFQPRGRLNFTANIERFPDQPQDMDVLVDVRGCSLEPLFLPYLLHDLSGQFRFHANRLDITKARARHNDVHLELDQGSVDIRPGGGHYTDLKEIRIRNLYADHEFLKALPKPLQSFIGSLDLKDPVNVKTRLVVSQAAEPGSPAEVWWDGQLFLNDAKLTTGVDWSNVTGIMACTGRHNGRVLQGLAGNMLLEQVSFFKQPFKNVHGKFHVKDGAPEIFNMTLHAPVFGGDVTGQVRVEVTSALRYELNLTASQINLKEFGQHNLGPSSQLNGIAVGRLHLTGMGSNVNTLDGNGSIDVPNGRLYNLPLLLDLLKFLGLRWPDRTAFEELHALFSIQGTRLTMRRLDLTGNAISLSGKGDFNLDGTDLNLDFYPTWARIEQLLPPAVRPLPPVFSKNLLTIEMRGKVSNKPEDLKFNKKLVPLLTDPLLFVRDRVVSPNPQAGEKN